MNLDFLIRQACLFLVVSLIGLAASASGDVRQVADPAKSFSPLYMRALDACPLVIDDANMDASLIELDQSRGRVSLASGWNQRIYWDRIEKTTAELPGLLSMAANSRPRPYLILSSIGGDRADFSAMEDSVIHSGFCTTLETTSKITEVRIPNPPNSPNSPNSMATPAARKPSAIVPAQPAPKTSNVGSDSRYQAPVSAIRVNSGYFDANYPPEQDRQHLGVDLAAAKGTDVLAPVSGRVVANFTANLDVAAAFLIIRASDGSEHVLGHISSNLTVGATVTIGKKVGEVRPWPNEPGRAHVHWGINRIAVPRIKLNGWGWGKAPVNATRSQAAAHGWIDPMTGLK